MTMDHSDFNPNRRLCADGSCVGVIGADDRCKVCGLPAAGPSSGGLRAVPAASPEPDEQETAPPGVASERNDDGGFIAQRRLCEDGSCIGVIGADGVCSVCGRSAEGAG